MKIRYNSPVILTYAILCTGIMFLNDLTGGGLSSKFFAVYPTMNFASPLAYWQLLSHVVGHQSWSHLMGNFAFILLLGPILEEKYGSSRLLTMIVFTALITGILNVALFPTGLMGASGIVFMFIILSSFTNFKGMDIPLTFILIILIFLTREIGDAVRNDNISQFAHILGGILGSFFGFWYRK